MFFESPSIAMALPRHLLDALSMQFFFHIHGIDVPSNAVLTSTSGKKGKKTSGMTGMLTTKKCLGRLQCAFLYMWLVVLRR